MYVRSDLKLKKIYGALIAHKFLAFDVFRCANVGRGEMSYSCFGDGREDFRSCV